MHDDDRNTRPTPVPPTPGMLTVDGWQTRQLRALWVLVTLLLLAVVAREVWPRRIDARPVVTCPTCPPPAAPAPCAACPANVCNCPACPAPVVSAGRHHRDP